MAAEQRMCSPQIAEKGFVQPSRENEGEEGGDGRREEVEEEGKAMGMRQGEDGEA